MPRDYLTLAEAQQYLHSSGVKTTLKTMNVWASRGIKANGSSVKLQCVKFGGRLYTTNQWLEQFCDRCTAAMPPQIDLPQTDRNLRFLAAEGF